jgi:hypothetical protein
MGADSWNHLRHLKHATGASALTALKALAQGWLQVDSSSGMRLKFFRYVPAISVAAPPIDDIGRVGNISMPFGLECHFHFPL